MSRRFPRWALWAIAAAALPLVARALWRFPWHVTGRALAGADGWLLAAALVVNLSSLAAKGWAWHLLLRPVAPHRWWIAQEANLIGAATSNLSVSVVGEAQRTMFLVERGGVPAAAAAVSVIWARSVEAVALGCLLVTAGFLLRLPPPVLAVAVTAGIGMLSLVSLAWWGRRSVLPAWMPGQVRSLARAFGALGDPRRLPAPAALGLYNWLAEWATYHLTLLAVHVPVTYAASLAALLAANLGGALRLTPANVGIFQTSLVLGLLPFGVSAGHAVAAGVVLQALQVLPVLGLAAAGVGWRGLRALLAGRVPPAAARVHAAPGFRSGRDPAVLAGAEDRGEAGALRAPSAARLRAAGDKP